MKLLDLFDICEDLEDTNGLESLFFIIKDICKSLLHLPPYSNVPSHPFCFCFWYCRGSVLLNDRSIQDPILKDENIIKVIGILECWKIFPALAPVCPCLTPLLRR